MKPSALTALLLALALAACDDDEHTSNLPPDLRLEDVVGCWYVGGGGYCTLKCFDIGSYQFYLSYDSTYDSRFESVGRYWINRFTVTQRVVGKSGDNVASDTIEGSISFRRVDKYLYTLDENYQLAKRYDPVANLDSLPCGKPFTLLSKPANWTLF